MIAVFKREFKSYFTNPLGFIFLAIIYAFSGYLFKDCFYAGAPYVEIVVLSTAQILLFIVPVITMRLFSDERRQKTDQVLFTSPVKLINIVFGKYFAALALYALGFAPTIIYQIIVSSYVSVNWFYYIYAIIGIILFGAAIIAIGMFISSLTESPIISIVFTLAITLFILLSPSLAERITVATDPNGVFAVVGAWILQRIVDFLNGMNFVGMLESFAEKAFAFNDIIYFLSISAAFVFLTERALEKRRWS